MRDSIIVDMKYADFDIINGQYGVERHHCLGGPNRKKADEDGLWVPLTPEHHRTGKISAHQSTEVQKLLQIIAQLSYELNEVSQVFKSGSCSCESKPELRKCRGLSVW